MAGKITPLRGLAPEDVTPRQVVSYETSTLFPTLNQERYNPDELATRKGLRIYARMMDDEQVKAVMNFRLSSITARGFEFRYPDDSPLAPDERQARIGFFQYNTDKLRGSFQDGLHAVLRGHVFGFSMTEKVLDVQPYQGKERNCLAALLPRDPVWFRFFTDRYGTLLRIEQHIGNERLVVDPAKFIHYVRCPEVDRYYGQSDLKAAHRSWYIKDITLKLHATYLERFAGGFAWAELPPESNLRDGSEEHEALKTALSNLRNLTSLILPPGVKLNVLQPGTTAEYREALTYHDMAIAKAMLVPNLLGLSHAGQTGSFSQSQTQLEAYFMTTAADTARLQDALNEQLFKDLGDVNWGDGEYPRFCFKPASAEHVKWMVTTFKELAGANVVMATEADEAHLRRLLELPARAEDDVLQKETQLELDERRLAAEAKHRPAPAQLPFTLEQVDGKLREHGERLLEKIASRPAAGSDRSARPNGKDHTDAPPALDSRRGRPRSVDRVTFARAAARVDFALIERRHATLSESGSEQVAQLAARAVKRLLSDERVGELLAQPDSIAQLAFDGPDVGRIKSGFKDALGAAWQTGADAAARELGKAQAPATFADLRGRAADYFEANGFRMAANLTDGMRAIIQQELINAVKTGARPEQVVALVYDRLVRKGFVTLRALEREELRTDVLAEVERLLADALEVANVPAYLNTLVRTNTFEALNEARFATFEQSAEDGFVVAYEYSALLDDNTTEICRALDDGVWAHDSSVWDTYRPPNHYNCRSLLVAVTVLDRWDGVESPAPTVEPQEGFK